MQYLEICSISKNSSGNGIGRVLRKHVCLFIPLERTRVRETGFSARSPMLPSTQHFAQLVPEVQHAGKDFGSDFERRGRKTAMPGAARAQTQLSPPRLQARGFESRQFTAASIATQVTTAPWSTGGCW